MSRFNITVDDACNFLAGLEHQSVDLLITDPAYESLEKHRAKGTTTRLKQSEGSSNEWFPIFPNSRYEEFFARCWEVMKEDTHLYVFCDQETNYVIKPIAEAAGFTFWKPIIWDKCLSPDTPVLTSRGIQSVGALTPEDKIVASDGEFYPVLAKRRLQGRSLRIGLSDGTAVVSSPEHLFRKNGLWIEAEDLEPGDVVDVSRPNTKHHPAHVDIDSLISDDERILELPSTDACLWCGQQFSSSRSAAAHQARFCDQARSKKSMAAVLGVPVKRLQYWLNRGQIPATWAQQLGIEEKATGSLRLRMANDPSLLWPKTIPLDHEFGRVIGLYAAEGSRSANTLAFHLNKDRQTLRNFVSMFFRQFGLKPHLSETQGCISVRLHHSLLPRLIQHFMSGTKAPEKRFLAPTYAAAGEEFRSGVFWGLIDGDGHWSSAAQRQQFCSSSIGLAMFIHREAVRRGWRVRTKEILNDKSGAYHVAFDPSVKQASLRVESVEQTGECELVDISVGSPDSSFLLANGVVTHNCSIGMGYHYRARYEMILFFEKGKRNLNDLSIPDIITAKRVQGGYPTEKPVEVCDVLVAQSSEPGEVIVDPFNGSGATGVSAVKAGRFYLGCDVKKEAVEKSVERLREAGGVHDPDFRPLSADPQLGLF
jgi:DNA modification methylase